MGRTHRVTFLKSGITVDVDEDERVLVAGLRAGVPLAFSCRQGMCKTCMVPVQGIIDQSHAYIISEQELAEGYALICVGHPRSDLRVEA